jgi:hypothetical protein
VTKSAEEARFVNPLEKLPLLNIFTVVSVTPYCGITCTSWFVRAVVLRKNVGAEGGISMVTVLPVLEVFHTQSVAIPVNVNVPVGE